VGLGETGVPRGERVGGDVHASRRSLPKPTRRIPPKNRRRTTAARPLQNIAILALSSFSLIELPESFSKISHDLDFIFLQTYTSK